MLDLSSQVTQKQFGDLVGISQPAVADLQMRGVIADGAAVGSWLIDYCRHIREQAAGRTGDLSEERARLARAQAEKVEMQNAVTRGEMAPVALIEQVLTGAASKVSGILDAIPGMVRRRLPQLTSGDIDLIATEVAKARNAVAGLSLADLSDDGDEDASVQPAPTFDEALGA